MFYVEIDATKRHETANLLESNRYNILEKWIKLPRVANVLNEKNINHLFFITHFGSRVLDYFIGVFKAEKMPGSCPVVIVMMKFFAKRGMKLDEIYQICSGMKHSVLHTLLESGLSYSDVKITAATELFDANFSGVIREYLQMDVKNHFKKADEAGFSCSARYCVSDTSAPPVEENINSLLLKEYFAADEEDDSEKVLFRTEDADDLMEYFCEVPERVSLALIHSDPNEIKRVANIFSHTSSILLHYSPFLDTLAESMSELSVALHDHTEEFMEALQSSESGMLRLFDAVSSDMDRYIERFSVENIAMKNSHHIHEPTTLSIRQIITLFVPDLIDEGEIEFF